MIFIIISLPFYSQSVFSADETEEYKTIWKFSSDDLSIKLNDDDIDSNNDIIIKDFQLLKKAQEDKSITLKQKKDDTLILEIEGYEPLQFNGASRIEYVPGLPGTSGGTIKVIGKSSKQLLIKSGNNEIFNFKGEYSEVQFSFNNGEILSFKVQPKATEESKFLIGHQEISAKRKEFIGPIPPLEPKVFEVELSTDTAGKKNLKVGPLAEITLSEIIGNLRKETTISNGLLSLGEKYQASPIAYLSPGGVIVIKTTETSTGHNNPHRIVQFKSNSDSSGDVPIYIVDDVSNLPSKGTFLGIDKEGNSFVNSNGKLIYNFQELEFKNNGDSILVARPKGQQITPEYTPGIYTLPRRSILSTPLKLKTELINGDQVVTAWSLDGKTWKSLDETDTKDFSTPYPEIIDALKKQNGNFDVLMQAATAFRGELKGTPARKIYTINVPSLLASQPVIPPKTEVAVVASIPLATSALPTSEPTLSPAVETPTTEIQQQEFTEDNFWFMYNQLSEPEQTKLMEYRYNGLIKIIPRETPTTTADMPTISTLTASCETTPAQITCKKEPIPSAEPAPVAAKPAEKKKEELTPSETPAVTVSHIIHQTPTQDLLNEYNQKISELKTKKEEFGTIIQNYRAQLGDIPRTYQAQLRNLEQSYRKGEYTLLEYHALATDIAKELAEEIEGQSESLRISEEERKKILEELEKNTDKRKEITTVFSRFYDTRKKLIEEVSTPGIDVNRLLSIGTRLKELEKEEKEWIKDFKEGKATKEKGREILKEAERIKSELGSPAEPAKSPGIIPFLILAGIIVLAITSSLSER